MAKRYTTKEAAIELGIKERQVRRYCKDGRLGEKHGRDYFITERELKAFKKKPRKSGNPNWVKKKRRKAVDSP